MKLWVKELQDTCICLAWEACRAADSYRIYWADKDTGTVRYKCLAETKGTEKMLSMSTHVNHYFKAVAWQNNCYNQPGYTKFYFAADTDWRYVLQ